MAEHAKLSPSAAERWINCPPSIKLSEDFPDTTSIYAQEGTVAHKLAELKVDEQLNDKTVPTEDYETVRQNKLYSKDMEYYTDQYVNYINDLKEEVSVIQTETRLEMNDITPETFGTADCILMQGDHLHIIDFKYGRNVKVDATENSQLKLYALGALAKFDNLLFNFKEITVHIVQPRMDNFSSFTISKEDLLDWSKFVKQKAQEALEGTGEFASGEWCKFCPAKAVCREYSKTFPLDTKRTDPDKLSNEELAALLHVLDGLEAYHKEVKEYTLTHALQGEKFPGFKLVAGRSNRSWKNWEQAEKQAVENGIDRNELYDVKPKSLAAIERLMGKKKFKEIMSDQIEKPEGKPTLVEITDKREEYALNSAFEDFKELGGKN